MGRSVPCFLLMIWIIGRYGCRVKHRSNPTATESNLPLLDSSFQFIEVCIRVSQRYLITEIEGCVVRRRIIELLKIIIVDIEAIQSIG